MTLDEAIKRFINNAEYERTRGSLEGCLEFKQLAEWLKELKAVREAETEPNTGHWVSQRGGGYCCSECGRYALDKVDGNFISVAFKSNFCPYCGADMRGEQDE